MTIALDQLPAEVRTLVEGLQIENHLLRELLRLERLKKYGPRSEKLSDLQLQLLGQEPLVTPAEIEHEARLVEADEQAKTPRVPCPERQHPGRLPFPPHLERRIETIPVPPEECHCPLCQQEKAVIGYEESEQLDMDPVKLFIRVVRREKRACGDCQEGVVIAPVPARIVPKGKLGDELVIELTDGKVERHLPVYRQCEALRRDAGVELSRQTVCGVILHVGDLLEPIRQVLRADLLSGGYIQADETPFGVQSPEVRGRNHRGQIWTFGRPHGPVVFDFQMSRGRAGPREFLSGFQGILQSDGYSVYDQLGTGIVYAACLAHVRRKFHDAHLLSPEDPVPRELVERIAQIYAVEAEAASGSAPPEVRGALRQERSRPLMKSLKERVIAVRQEVLPQSVLGKACDYALGQWPRLEVFLEHGQVEVDNNWAENALRPIVLGRKNFLHIGSEWAGPRLAALWSVYGTCRRLGINTRAYLRDVLPRLADWPAKRVAELSPLLWNR